MEQYQWLANFGFAAVVAGYVLVRLEPAIRQLQKSITVLTVVVAQTSGVDYEKARKMVEGSNGDYWKV